MTAYDTATCDGCGEDTFDLMDCDHDRQLCGECVAEGKCNKCREVHHALSNWRLG